MRALIVEDEGLILLELAMILEDLGHQVVGTASDLSTGLALGRELSFDIAILDGNIAGRDSGPIADVMVERDIPFLFVSGYTREALPPRHTDRPLLSKPLDVETLRHALQQLLPLPQAQSRRVSRR